MKRIISTSLLAACSVLALPLQAELLIDPMADTGKTSFSIMNGQTRYLDTSGATIKIERTLFSTAFRMPTSQGLELFGAFALYGNSRIAGASNGGNGIAFSGGLIKKIQSTSGSQLNIYSQFQYHSEEIVDAKSISTKTNGVEISLGALASQTFNNSLTIFAGCEYIFLTDAEFESKSGGQKAKGDIERGNLFGLRTGVSKDTGDYRLSAAVSMLSESVLSFGLSRSF
jgi:hypothetical protein